MKPKSRSGQRIMPGGQPGQAAEPKTDTPPNRPGQYDNRQSNDRDEDHSDRMTKSGRHRLISFQ